MRVAPWLLTILLASIVAPQLRAQTPPAALNFLTKPLLLECGQGGAEPCFRLNFGFVDADGRPSMVPLPRKQQLLQRIELQVDGQQVLPFYVSATGEAPGGQLRPPQTAILLLDVSGSMLRSDLGGESRFDAAKSAASEYLKGFVDGRDRLAILPFASRDVEKTIAAAKFVSTRSEAQTELNALTRPEARNNTALYSAVASAVRLLATTRRSKIDQARLLLLTDGTNDVQPQAGDDQGLLTGPSGLATAATEVEQSGVDVLPIGIGDQHSLDETSLARLGTQPPLITFDLAALRRAFQLPQSEQTGGITATLKAPSSFGSRALLAGRVIHFRAKMTLSDGTILVEDRPALWVAPPVVTPSFSGEASEAEQRAYLTSAGVGDGSVLLAARPFIVFAGFALLLALLWFGLPRLIWSDRYDNRSARPLRPEYWPGSEMPLQPSDSFAPRPPPGFEPSGRGGRMPARGAGENTIVRPGTDFESTKTRLT